MAGNPPVSPTVLVPIACKLNACSDLYRAGVRRAPLDDPEGGGLIWHSDTEYLRIEHAVARASAEILAADSQFIEMTGRASGFVPIELVLWEICQ